MCVKRETALITPASAAGASVRPFSRTAVWEKGLGDEGGRVDTRPTLGYHLPTEAR
jgi:hypothetical protein